MDDRPIVVGVDGSGSSRKAIDVAVAEARLHHRPVRLVHAFIWPTLGVYVGPSPEGPPDGGLAAEADRLLAEARLQATSAAPDLTITGEVVTGAPAAVMLAEAERAWLVVLGSRGLGGFAGLLVGSVAVQVASHIERPLLVVRGEPHASGPVLVGVDGPASDEAVEFAFREAAVRGAEVVALHAWHSVSGTAEEQLPLVYDRGDVESMLARQLAESLAAMRERFPSVPVRQEVQHGRPSRLLVEASRRAQLVVVGSRGRGGFAGLLLGSVSQALLHHAGCPVVVVRGHRTG